MCDEGQMGWTMCSKILGIDQSGCHILSARHVLTLVVGVSCPVCTRYTHNSRTCVKHTHFPFQHPIFHLRLFPFDFLFSPTDLDSISSNHLSLRLRMQLQLHPRSTITVYRLPLFGEVNIEKYSNVFVLNFLRNPIYN